MNTDDVIQVILECKDLKQYQILSGHGTFLFYDVVE